MNNQSEWSLDQNKKTKKEKKKTLKGYNQKPTSAYIGASWVALLIGISSYCIGLWNVEMELNEKGYYFTVLLFALFSVISVQKSVRDRLEGIKVTEIYYSISWFTTIASIVLLVVGLWNANLLLSEKGFYAMSFSLSVYAAISVQKNTRDIEYINKTEEKEDSE
ncbi:YiaA/YiaB family protein [Tenacibaculum sp. 1B UA]|uniref:inner membrane protein YiaA n=1 Tax=unclassified Tenacibaculum TaxID=2635139 RepID=UPI0026E160FB|nr:MULTISPECIES: inner membrane protein YiaA [unclassified Tenacibaculum]MDO6675596.1 inner membrane protein YiaA [Tenacibaculum sp. 1_MG-2023]MDX8553029.1 YiaA/YiaB family protein [Tenacibaculum sp. 1B UA]